MTLSLDSRRTPAPLHDESSVVPGFEPVIRQLNDLLGYHGHNDVVRVGVSVEDDEPAGRLRSAITDQNIAKMRAMSGFPLTSVVRLLINTTSLKY
ncbi:hypothetical protein TNCV_4595901 [Trichonephila clavipes]|uniref:Uncharacterized protein n=1 Tax=Trichonephila clavipes TaxID=2585209 RepID=A0A8X6WG15_TRICX|nr:hypothetical protein TNCV_4595901 [Trichonephila clavipes]